MSATNIVSLTEAKNYLRIDDDLTSDDTYITSLIYAAVNTVERVTNIFAYARDKVYNVSSGLLRVYDYPINSVVAPTDYEMETLDNYANITFDNELETVTLNVGFSDAADYPTDLKIVILELISLMYYDRKDASALSELSKSILNNSKRFLI